MTTALTCVEQMRVAGGSGADVAGLGKCPAHVLSSPLADQSTVSAAGAEDLGVQAHIEGRADVVGAPEPAAVGEAEDLLVRRGTLHRFSALCSGLGITFGDD
ncbi:hypothetical protein KDL01_29355 [Actinospica durhamensis]|uniref:Uncharacterized protein n=1 Tax=Actinospica durhamensis TaxID=1508375 RepID=A0A941EVY3_9ACTN|nr:hypothetical protein [Actinospica durhamensis]MBR7837423.1 hypothetical protein [Actinospica durhamensis]